MYIRMYRRADCEAMAELFHNTVHTVNARDYTPEQLDAWAAGRPDIEKWDRSFREHYSVVAVEGDMIVGFGDVDKSGYLDRLFVHADYQGRGIASAICDRLEQQADGNITVHASVTAKPFFEKRGYETVREQQVEKGGVALTNYIMRKTVSD